MLTEEQSSVDSLKDPTMAGQNMGHFDARRRLVRGGLMGAPLLLTLPRVSSANSSNEMCVEPKSLLTEAEAVSPSGLGNYVAVQRPAYQITISGSPHILVYAGPYSGANTCTGLSQWHDAASWSSTYTANSQNCDSSTTITFTQGGNNYTGTWVGMYYVMVQVDSTGTPTGVIGPSQSATYIISASCWTSAMPGTSLPQ